MTTLPIEKAPDIDTLSAPITQAEMEEAKHAMPLLLSQSSPTKTPIIPVSEDAPSFNFMVKKFGGAPTYTWTYYNEKRQLVGYICRWNISEADGIRKEIRPVCYCDLSDGKKAWCMAGVPEPRPLYRLPEIIDNPNALIIIHEGEKCADAGQLLFPDAISTTPMHGAKSPHKTDWSPIKGRKVLIVTDADEAGETFGDAVFALCRQAAAESILHLPAKSIGKYCLSEKGIALRSGEAPKGYDLADAWDEGWTAEALARLVEEKRLVSPYIREEELSAINDTIRGNFRLTSRGVECAIEGKKRNGEREIEWVWLCSHLAVRFQTRDEHGENWGRILEIIDNDGRRKEYVMPMSALAGDGVTLREELLSLGVQIAGNGKALLHTYLTSSQPKDRATCVSKTGWFGKAYVMPHKVYGKTGNERVVLQTGNVKPYIIRGTLQQWQETIGAYAIGNDRMIFVISLALTGTLLGLLGEENFGAHIFGRSSSGKTTLLQVGQSITGGPIHSWRTTDNAAESLARGANDSVLFLDELSQVDGNAADAMAYMLGNGQGKARARRDGTAKAIEKFRLVFMSSGELSLADKILERGRTAKAGQAVRFIEIPADAQLRMGAFQNLHHFSDSNRLAIELKRLSAEYSGAVMDAFLEAICSNLEIITERIIAARKFWAEQNAPAAADGQVIRVTQKFGLIAAAGELAISFGILPWPPGTASLACKEMLSIWLKERGGTGAHEFVEVEKRLRSFIAQHGSSRFEAAWGNSSEEPTLISPSLDKTFNRAGFRKLNANAEWEYFVAPDVFEKEILGSANAQSVKKHLAERGLLQRDSQGKYTVSTRVPGHKTARFYHIPASIAEKEEDDANA